jgi:hemerythrin-like domain-containing protein
MSNSAHPGRLYVGRSETAAAHKIVAANSAATRILATLLIHGRRGRAETTPDFSVMEALLSYIDKTVRGVHFAIEEACLAAPLTGLRADLRSKVAQLRRDHIGTGGYCARMREAIALWRKKAPMAARMYLDNARDHHRLSVMHGRLLRSSILPAAEESFSPLHWQQVETAFARIAGTGDPLAGCATRADFDSAVARLTVSAAL